MDLTNAELAILSLIVEEPRHGYQIETVIDERNMRSWTEVGFSSIYRILTKLEKDGLTKGQPGPPEGRGPARKVYHITPKGQEVWRQASLKALSSPAMSNSTFLLGLDNLYELDPAEAITALNTYRETITFSRDYLVEHVQKRTMHFYMEAFFDYLISKFDWEIEWLGNFTTKMVDHNNTGE